MNGESFERETTRGATLTLPDSVARQFGRSSAPRRPSGGDGFHATDFGSAGHVLLVLALEVRAGWAGRALAEGRVSVIRSLLDARDCAGKISERARVARIVYDYN